MTTARGVHIPDIVREGIAAGWDVVDASTLDADLIVEADVAIVGSGAGGGVTAETLALAGFKVVVLEEGPLRSSSDFRMREAEAYPELYQESAARKTRDKAINILQGRCVGGGTTVNWTSSFRTPPSTLGYWQRTLGIEGLDELALAPWFAKMEDRLGIAPWTIAPNANTAALARGAAKLGIESAAIRRNVRGCWNLGYCGMGCPTNAKQSMLVTTLPAALGHGAKLVTRVRAEKLVLAGDRVDRLVARALDATGTTPTARTVTVRARGYVVAAGAIGSPALLLRSGVPDPHALVGKRTFLHPAIVSAARMDERIEGYAGAPQTIYSDHWLEVPFDGPAGFKLEAPPIHPALAATTLTGHGEGHARWMRDLPTMHVLIALIRDGFHRDSPGGTVALRDDGTPVLDYPLNAYLFDAMRRAFVAMAELQFAAGARTVMPVHGRGDGFDTAEAARRAIGGFAIAPLATPVVSAHVMGGCPLGADPKHAVVDTSGRHHHLANLHVIDGSLFPTSIGANPQLSIYAVAAKLSDALATSLGRKPHSV
ncbi:MAG: GMC family oxidoreductase N-terminal domain-containing protein [Vicinamibacteria bacterium]